MVSSHYAAPGVNPGNRSIWYSRNGSPPSIIYSTTFFPYGSQDAINHQKMLKDKVSEQRKVIGYFPEWGVYDAHNNFTPDKIDFSQITHLNYGFAVIKNGVVGLYDTEKGAGLMFDLTKRTKAAGVTNVISVGGYTNSQEGVFEEATKTAAGVEILSQSIVNYMLRWGFDGVDIDWEYPDTEAEKVQYTNLIKNLRDKLDELGFENDVYYQLSSAVTANYQNIGFMNPAVTTPLLDSVNVMAYDFHGAFDPITGHNAGLYANKADPSDQKFNTSSIAEAYSKNWSVPKSKLMLGIPYYGRGWGAVKPTIVAKGLPGLFTSGLATVHGLWDDLGQYTGTNPYYQLRTWSNTPDYTRYWDSEAKVPYLYNSKTKEFFTYDDKESVQAKVDYINNNGYGGAIIWDLSGDTADHELGEVVDDIIEEGAVNDAFVSKLEIVTESNGSQYVAFFMSGANTENYVLSVNNNSIANVGANNTPSSNLNKTPYSKDFRYSTKNHMTFKSGDTVSLLRGNNGEVVSKITVPVDITLLPKKDDEYTSSVQVVMDSNGETYAVFHIKVGHPSEQYEFFKNNESMGVMLADGMTEHLNKTPVVSGSRGNIDYYRMSEDKYGQFKYGDVLTVVRGDKKKSQVYQVETLTLTSDNLPSLNKTPNEFYLKSESQASCASIGTSTLLEASACINNNSQQFKSDDKQQLTVENKCMDISGSNNSDGATIGAYNCHGGTNQKWVWDNAKVRSLLAGTPHCMSIQSNNKIVLKTCNDNDASQKFRRNTFIRSEKTGTVLDIQYGLIREGDRLEVYPLKGGQHQQFALTEDQSFKVGNLCLDVQGGNNVEGANVITYRCSGSANQKWAWDNDKIKSMMGGVERCLNVNANNLVSINSCDDNNASQKFTSIIK